MAQICMQSHAVYTSNLLTSLCKNTLSHLENILSHFRKVRTYFRVISRPHTRKHNPNALVECKDFHLKRVQAEENVAYFSLPSSVILCLDNNEDKALDVVLRHKK